MHIEVSERGSFASVLAEIQPGEKLISESGAMFRASPNVDIDVTTKTAGGKGGLFSGIKRWLASESFFFSTYTVTDGEPGEVGLAPTHQGEIRQIRIDGTTEWFCTGGSYLASTDELAIETEFQGMKGLFTGESLSFVKVSGIGELIVNAFGRISELDVHDDLIVDTGHVVAFESSLNYSISKAGGSWFHSWLAGEGLVLRFSGSGRILVQSHNSNELGSLLGPLLPPRS